MSDKNNVKKNIRKLVIWSLKWYNFTHTHTQIEHKKKSCLTLAKGEKAINKTVLHRAAAYHQIWIRKQLGIGTLEN